MTNWFKNKTKTNLVIDSIMLLVMTAIAGLGFLIKFVLIPGYKREALYPGDTELYFMGLTRHEWGKIHLLLGFIFLFLLLLHIILHWNMIGCIFRQMVFSKTVRRFIAVFLGVVSLLFLFAPLVMKPEVVSLPRKHMHSKAVNRFPENNAGKLPGCEQTVKEEKPLNEGNHDRRIEGFREHTQPEIEIYGYMTLNEVAIKYDVDAIDLSSELNIPVSLFHVKIGHLKRQYGFRNSEIREVILRITKNRSL